MIILNYDFLFNYQKVKNHLLHFFGEYKMEIKPVKILIVDDNPFNRELLFDILSEKYPVEIASSGNEAINKVMENQFNIILMDMLMPGLDGFETTKKIREMGINAKIIAHTSMSMKKDRRRCMESGCDEFLPKPIDKTKLFELITKFSSSSDISDTKEEIENKNKYLSDEIHFSDLNLLLVEEDDKVRGAYKEILEKTGFNITDVHNGNQALSILEQKKIKIDIVISNMFTSGIDGLGLLNSTKRQFPNIYVFIYAAKFDPATLQLTVQLGADGIIPQSEFENSVAGIVHTAIYHSNEKYFRISNAKTVLQVRESQARFTQFGCNEKCNYIDMAYSSLHDAGGDMSQCRHFNLAGRCGIVMADVSGHDILSSYISAVFLGVLSSLWNINQDPSSLLKKINSELLKMEEVNYHVCTTVILWDMRRSKLKIATAGNPGAILLEKDNNEFKRIDLEGGGMCLGLLDIDNLFLEQEIDLKKGSFLFLFSDGIESEKITSILKEHPHLLNQNTSSGISKKMLDLILDKWPQQKDDMILLTLQAPDPLPDEGLHYSFTSDYEEVDKACVWITENINDHITEDMDIDMMLLSIREALLNAVEHGNNYKADAYVDVSIFLNEENIRIDISDEGQGFNLNDKLSDIKADSNFQIGKRGLPIINAFADKMEVNGGTVSVFFETV